MLDGPCQRLTLYVGESDRHGHTPLATELVRRAHAAGLAGASVFRGVEGFGASHHLHTTRILSLSDDLPMAVVIVDRPEAIAAFLAGLDDVVTAGMAVVEDVRVVPLPARPPGTR